MRALGLAIGAALYLSLVGQAHAAGDVVRGETAYGADCASCHRSVDRIAASANSESGDQSDAELDSFLSGHFAPDAETRADIIAYLKSLKTD